MIASSLPPLTLIIGGARSGKSRYAETLVMRAPAPWLYVATAEARDAEMTERIALHRERRGEGWVTVDVPFDLAGRVEASPDDHGAVLIDCLTLWLTNVMLAGHDTAAARARLVATLPRARRPVVAVSNEVGLGIVPENALARAFRDEQGRLNAEIAAIADRVVLMAAGLPLTLK